MDFRTCCDSDNLASSGDAARYDSTRALSPAVSAAEGHGQNVVAIADAPEERFDDNYTSDVSR